MAHALALLEVAVTLGFSFLQGNAKLSFFEPLILLGNLVDLSLLFFNFALESIDSTSLLSLRDTCPAGGPDGTCIRVQYEFLQKLVPLTDLLLQLFAPTLELGVTELQTLLVSFSSL